MKYPYLTVLIIISFALILFIGIIIFYFLVKLFQKGTKSQAVFKSILFYELCSLIIYLIFPYPLFSKVFSNYLIVLDFFLFSVVLFLIFYFIFKKILLINWKKSLVLFFVIVILLFPSLSYLGTVFEQKIVYSFPIFEEEIIRLEYFFKSANLFELLNFFTSPSNSLQIIEEIESGTLSWPLKRIREILIILL